MNNNILNTVVQDFIKNNLKSNLNSLILKGISFKNVEAREIIEQIEAKNKCESKLPTWFNTENIYYPNKLNIEQTSSEITAQYKLNIVYGESIIDLTGGFGVDSYYFSKQFKKVIYCEINKDLSRIASHNCKQLGVQNISIQNRDGIEYLKTNTNSIDWIYVDPSRRHDTKGKVFYLKDCLPNIPKHLELLFSHSKNILLKASPMLDISIGISELKHVKAIHVVAINNEVKELLFHLENKYLGNISIKTINIKKDVNEEFKFNLEEEHNSNPIYDSPHDYLYEPNASILKSGAFKIISYILKLSKLHKHSHLYTSTKLIDFPGRRFKILEVLPYNKKVITKRLGNTKANISVRNFPESVNQLRSKYKIKDGGYLYVFFTTNLNDDKIVIITIKI